MKVRTIVPHASADKQEHPVGDAYELEGIELALRLKDFIVVDAALPDPAQEPPTPPAVAAEKTE